MTLHNADQRRSRLIAAYKRTLGKHSRWRAFSPAAAKPRSVIFGYSIAVFLAIVAVVPGFAASCETSFAATTILSSAKTRPPVIVVGFLGGFVGHDEKHHPEVQMMQGLRKEYPKQVYFALFESRKVGEAYKAILSRLSAREDGTLSDDERSRACILLFGHSWGAAAVITLSNKLARAGIPIALTVQVDSVAKPFQNDRMIPSNVLQAVNFYQTRGLIHGQTRISPADPSRTTILGNFRWQYTDEPKECRDFPWYARLFTKGHIEIECDPQIWLQIKTLLRRSLPSTAGIQAEAVQPTLSRLSNNPDAIRRERSAAKDAVAAALERTEDIPEGH